MSDDTRPEPGPVDTKHADPQPSPRRVLVPDNEDLVDLVRQSLDLVEHLEANEQDTDLHDPQAEPWVLPAPFAGSVALAALYRVRDALETVVGTFHDEDHPPGPRVLGPDARYEHTPLRAVDLDPADLETLAEALQVISQALTPSARAAETNPWARQRLHDLAELLTEFVPGVHRGNWPNPTETLDSPHDAARPLARLVAVLSLESDDDLLTLTAALAAPDTGDLVLTREEEAAYQRVATRINQEITNGSGLARFLY